MARFFPLCLMLFLSISTAMATDQDEGDFTTMDEYYGYIASPPAGVVEIELPGPDGN